MAYGVILGQTPAPPASNVSYDNSSTSGTISSTNVQDALNNVVTKTNSLQNQINTTNSNLTTNVNNLQGQINSLSSQIGSGLKANLVVNKTYTSPPASDSSVLDNISFAFGDNIIGVFIKVSGSWHWTISRTGYGDPGRTYYSGLSLTSSQFSIPDIICSFSNFRGTTPTQVGSPNEYNVSANNQTFGIRIVSNYIVGGNLGGFQSSDSNPFIPFYYNNGNMSITLNLSGNFEPSIIYYSGQLSNVNVNFQLYTITI